MSYELLPEYWGKGYATEAVEAALGYAFVDLGLERVVAETQAANERSCRLLERLGMKAERKLERFGAKQVIYPRKLKDTVPANQLKAVTIADTHRGGAGHRMHRAFELDSRVTMVAISDPDEEGRSKLTAECGATGTYSDYREMLEREKPDIAVIARHWFDDGRVDEFLAALDAGVRGLFVEKSVAAWPDQARRMQQAAAERDVPVLLAHRSREHPTMQEIRRRAREGEWGPLTRVRAMDKGDHRVGVHEAMIHTPHVFDAMLYLVDEAPTSCWGSVTLEGRPATRDDARGVEYLGAGPMAGDKISAQFQFPSGVVGTFESMPVGDGSYGSDRLGVDFIFQDAVVTARNQPLGKFHVFPRGDVFPTDPDAEWTTLGVDSWIPEGVHPTDWSNHVICEDLVRLIDGGEPRPESPTIDLGVVGVEMLVGAYRSHLEGRRIDLPLADPNNPWL